MLILSCEILVVASAVFVLFPLFTEPRGNLEAELLAETALDRLLNRKAVVYTNLKDLEFEYKMGRLGAADYDRLAADYKAEAAGILQKRDEIGVGKDIDESIERDIAARKSRRFSPSGKRADVCPGCGSKVMPGKKFCADCGRSL